MKKGVFKYGIIVGRFQHIHKGHQKLIEIGLRLCDKLLIFIGSANQENSARNPYSYEYRKSLIEIIYKDEIDSGKIIIAPLNDFKDSRSLTPLWGEYVLNSAKDILGEFPNCIIYGKDKDIFKCFAKEAVKKLSEVYVDRDSLMISATKMREFLLDGNKKEWEKYSDEKIHNKYYELKEKLEQYYCKKN